MGILKSLAEIEQLRAALLVACPAPPVAKYCPQAPHPKQQEFLDLTCIEALYGGAAAGGKSSAMLMAALQYVHMKDYAAIIFRRSFKDLSEAGAIMYRSHEWLDNTDAVWDSQHKRWTFPSGATIAFGYFDSESDKRNYMGAEFQFVGFDELTQFPEAWYEFMFTRLRRNKSSQVPLRMRAASNPGGMGHDWVFARFVDPTRKDRNATTRFVRATLEDNPSVGKEEYELSLSHTDAITWAQLREGQWIRDTGGLVYQFDYIKNISHAKHQKVWSFILGIDYGFRDHTAFAVLGWAPNDKTVYVVESFKKEELDPYAAAEIVREFQARYRFDRIVGDTGGLGKGYTEEARRRFGIPIEPAEKNNKRGYISLLNGALRGGRLVVMSPGNEGLIDEWRRLPWDQKGENESSAFDNHLADAVLYAWRACMAYTEEAVSERPPEGSREAALAEEKRMFETRLLEVSIAREQADREWWDR